MKMFLINMFQEKLDETQQRLIVTVGTSYFILNDELFNCFLMTQNLVYDYFKNP